MCLKYCLGLLEEKRAQGNRVLLLNDPAGLTGKRKIGFGAGTTSVSERRWYGQGEGCGQ